MAWMLEHPEEREAMGARAREDALAKWTPEHFRFNLAQAIMALC